MTKRFARWHVPQCCSSPSQRGQELAVGGKRQSISGLSSIELIDLFASRDVPEADGLVLREGQVFAIAGHCEGAGLIGLRPLQGSRQVRRQMPE